MRSIHGTVRAQRRHRDLLTLVARDDPAAPGALVLDHPSAAAYCLPGVRPQVVVSAGTLQPARPRPSSPPCSATSARTPHERHDLVLLPFTALCRALPWFALGPRRPTRPSPCWSRCAPTTRPGELHAEAPLAGALLRFAAAGHRITPAGALGMGDRDLDVRVQRLLVTDRPPRVLGATALAVASTLVALPITLFLS